MKSLVLLILVISLVSILSYVESAPLWGPTGHILTAQIAQTLLSSDALKQCKYLLPNVSGDLSSIVNWADQIKSQPGWEWSAQLHYINTPDWACVYTVADCPKNACVAGAIYNYTQQLLDSKLSYTLQVEALMFLVHFIGDIHQPLHCGFGSDEGGNLITGKFFGDSWNLHAIWDTGLIDYRISNDFGNNQGKYLAYLVGLVNGNFKNLSLFWENECQDDVCPDLWANQSAAAACQYSYMTDGQPIKNNFDLEIDYYDGSQEMLDQQIIKSGVRMATSLNRIFATSKVLAN